MVSDYYVSEDGLLCRDVHWSYSTQKFLIVGVWANLGIYTSNLVFSSEPID